MIKNLLTIVLVLATILTSQAAVNLSGGSGSVPLSNWSSWEMSNGKLWSPVGDVSKEHKTEIVLSTMLPNTTVSVTVGYSGGGDDDWVVVSTKNIDGNNSGPTLGQTRQYSRVFQYTKVNPGIFTLVVTYKRVNLGGFGYGIIHDLSYSVAPPTLYASIYLPNGPQNSVFRVIWTPHPDYYLEYAPSVVGPWSKLFGVFGGEIDGQIMYNGVLCNYTDDRTYLNYPIMFYRAKHR